MSDQAPTTPADGDQDQIPQDPRIKAMVDVFGQEFYSRFNDPVLFMALDLHTPVAQGMLRRDFALLSRSLLLDSVYRRRIGFNVEILDKFEAALRDKLAQVRSFFTTKNEQMMKIFSTQGMKPESAYMKVQHHSHIPIIATHARSFVGMLKELDDYYQLTGCATLYGLLDASQRRTAELQARKAVRAFLAVVRQEAIKLRKESLRLRMSEGGAEVSQEVAAAEASMDTAVANHDADAQAAGDQIPAEDAAAILDGIAATGKAAARAASRKESGPDAPMAAAA